MEELQFFYIFKRTYVVHKMKKKYLYSRDDFIEIEIQLLYSRDASVVIDYCELKFVWCIT